MDDNTLKFALAALGMLQVVMLAYFTYRQNVAAGKLAEVHTLVNGLSHEKTDAAVDAAGLRGQMAGRDFEAAKHPDALVMQAQIDANTAARQEGEKT